MKTSESIVNIAPAITIAYQKLQDARIDSKNPFFKSADKPKGSEYASLEAYLQEARPILGANGLALIQGMKREDDQQFLETVLIHKSGEWISYEMPLLISKNDMQGLGSAISYARRYSIAAILAMGEDDDDGNMNSEQAASNENQGKHIVDDRGKLRNHAPANDGRGAQKPPGSSGTPAGAQSNPSATPAREQISEPKILDIGDYKIQYSVNWRGHTLKSKNPEILERYADTLRNSLIGPPLPPQMQKYIQEDLVAIEDYFAVEASRMKLDGEREKGRPPALPLSSNGQ